MVSFDTAKVDLLPEPIDPSLIREGSPVARARRVADAADQTLSTGVWECTAGKFKWIYWFDEIVHIIEGEARVDDGIKTHILVPGTVVFFPYGLEAEWEVPKYIKKSFVLRAPQQGGRVRRVVSRVAQLVRQRIADRR
jgi:uncharacterized cupin superfamily protein